MPRSDQWIFVRLCDCPIGVMEGNLAEDEDEAFREMYDDVTSEQALEDIRSDVVARLIPFEDYVARYYPRMTQKCTHGGTRWTS